MFKHKYVVSSSKHVSRQGTTIFACQCTLTATQYTADAGAMPTELAEVAGLSLLFPLLRWLLNKRVFEPLAVRALQPVWQQSSTKVTAERMHNAVDKFSESLWKLCVYTVFTTLGITSLWGQPWVLDTWHLWLEWPNHAFSVPMQVLYHLELGFYVASVFMILFWEIRRKDFAAMFSHHIATVILISASLYFKFWRVGTIVMVLHDANDVLMEAAKLAKYSKKEDLAVGLFASFTVAWLLLRLVCFPLLVIRSTLFELPKAIDLQTSMYYMFNGLLCMLLVLHWYWFSLILRVVWLTLTTGDAQDVREDDDR